MNTSLNMQRMPIDRLKPAKYNPRKDLKPGDPAYEKIKRSLHDFGYVDPIVWNEVTGNIVGGHQRYKVLKAEGATEVDCVVVHIEDPQDEKALNIALNKATGDWEPVALAELLQDLQLSGYDLGATGFDAAEVGSDTNSQIRQGKSLTGIKYDVDMTDVVTRIMPTGEDNDGKVLYLPEVYIDSPHLADYPAPKWIHLAVSDCKEVTKGNKKKTKAKCYTQMREEAQAEFDKGCDLPTVTLTVEFIDVTQTEEYRQYSFLQSIFLGDAVRVIAKRVGVEVSMRMTAYTYNWSWLTETTPPTLRRRCTMRGTRRRPRRPASCQ